MTPLLRVGLTEWHGMIQEQAANPPPGVQYVRAKNSRPAMWGRLLRSPIKGFFPAVEDADLDVVESVMGPAHCRKPWLCSIANYQEVLAFSLLGLPTPRSLRQRLLEPLFASQRFLGFAFWSRAGLQTMHDYGHVVHPGLLAKARVVYPAMSIQPDRVDGPTPRRLLLFSGHFFHKGGIHVLETFERLQRRYPELMLRLCCDPDRDFNIGDTTLRASILQRIANHPRIETGRATRDVILRDLLPRSVAYLLPSYGEAFGFAVLEAMAVGVPVVATRQFAIPEMVQQGVNGWLLEYHPHEQQAILKDYTFYRLPPGVGRRLTDELCDRVDWLLQNPAGAGEMGRQGQQAAREQFSFEARGQALNEMYRGASGV